MAEEIRKSVPRRGFLIGGGVAGAALWAAPTLHTVRLGAASGTPPPASTTTTIASTTTTTAPSNERYLRLVPRCTAAEPYAIDIEMNLWEPSAQHYFTIEVSYFGPPGSYSDTFCFTMGADGSQTFTNVVPAATVPYELELTTFIDAGCDGTPDGRPDGVSFFAGFYSITEPCAVPGAGADIAPLHSTTR